MDDKIQIYKSRKKIGIIFITGLLLGLGGYLFIRYSDNPVAGWSFTILSALCLLFGVGSWVDRKPGIILTENGILETSGIREEIEWNAIRHADEVFFRGQYFLRLLVDRSYKPALLQPTWFHRFDRLYATEGVKALFIRISYMEVSSMALSRFINRMIKAKAADRPAILEQFKREKSHAGQGTEVV